MHGTETLLKTTRPQNFNSYQHFTHLKLVAKAWKQIARAAPNYL